MTTLRPRTLSALAVEIFSRAKALHKRLEFSDSDNINASDTIGMSQSDSRTTKERSIQEERNQVADAAREMEFVALGPQIALMQQCIHGIHQTHTLQAIYTFRIPQHVPLAGNITYEHLSRDTGLEEDKLRRILGYAYTMFMFCEPKKDCVAHSATSRLLATDTDAMQFLGHLTTDIFPWSSKQCDALQKWFSIHTSASYSQFEDKETAQAARSGFGYYINARTNPFSQWAQSSPEAVARFSGAMRWITASPIAPGYAFLDLFDWTSLNDELICDVGGSSGHKSKMMSREAKSSHFIVQDLPLVVEESEVNATLDDEMLQMVSQGRLNFEKYDFFTPQPVRSAKVYFFGHIFHDWGDEDCIRILENLVPSMPSGSFLVINDFVMTGSASNSLSDERTMRAFELQMMVALNARERTLEDWKALIFKGSSGDLHYCSSKFNGLVFVREM